MYLRALVERKKVWGYKHKQPQDTKYNLAVIYKEIFILKEAIKHFKLIVKGYIKVLDFKHSKTIKAFD